MPSIGAYPTPVQLDQWAATLTATDGRDITTRVAIHIDREKRGGDNQPDGYPTSTRGGTIGGSELTPTEAAAAARIQGVRDEHHDLTRNAVQWLEDVILATQACLNALAKMDARSLPDPKNSVDDYCTHHLAHGYAVPTYRGHLCSWCYGFNAEHRFLPTPELLDKHDRGRVYDRDIVEAKKRRIHSA